MTEKLMDIVNQANEEKTRAKEAPATTMEIIEAGGDITTTLTMPEQNRLEECERIIEQHIQGFLVTGSALAEIRDKRLYRATHKTFPKYCKQVWDLSKSVANYRIAGYEVVQNLLTQKMSVHETDQNESLEMATIEAISGKTAEASTMVDETDAEPLPPAVIKQEKEIILRMNEAQTRPLTKLSPDDQVKAWDLVLEQVNQGKKLTSYLIGQAVKEVKGEVFQKKVTKKKAAVSSTRLVSKVFAGQYQVLLDIVVAERKGGWKKSSKKEVVKHLEEMITIAEMKD